MEETVTAQPTLTAELGEARLIRGADGVSPMIGMEDITGGHRLTITDADGTRTVDIMDGADGARGEAGPQGPAGPAGEDYVLTAVDRAEIAAMAGGSAEAYYAGVDLTARFAGEIAEYSDVWAWIHARIEDADYDGIHVGDYIPFTTANKVSLTAVIAGIDTYTGGGGVYPVGHHIDFISREVWPTSHRFNRTAFNNGISSAVSTPWLASDLYYYVNSLSGTVPNAAEVGGGAGVAADYTSGGIYSYLPAALKAVIVQKYAGLPRRYSESGLLTEDSGSEWANIGYLWIPDEYEVFGFPVWGGSGYSTNVSVQYPLFAHNMRRAKKRESYTSRWWLRTACSGSTSAFTVVQVDGSTAAASASSASTYVPVCFRIG